MRSYTRSRFLLRRVREVRWAVVGTITCSRLDRGADRRFGGHFGCSGATPSTTNITLCLSTVVSSVSFNGTSSTSSLLAGKFLDLICLRVDNMGGVSKVMIDKLLIANVDQWGKVDNRGSD